MFHWIFGTVVALSVVAGEPTPPVSRALQPPIQIESAETSRSPVLVDAELLRVVQLEAGYKSGYDGSLAIASVIYNRLEAGRWGDTLHSVLSWPHQFSVYGNKEDVNISPECLRACQDATEGIRSVPEDILYFRTESSYRKMKNKSSYEVYMTKWGVVFMRERR